ncbi:MAG: plasmid stabilization protein [Agrobacterium albertimagni]
MAEPQLSVRSARARDLAHRLARRENRSIADIVERALEAYETQQTGREPASDFYRRIGAQSALDIDLDTSIRADRKAHEGPEL